MQTVYLDCETHLITASCPTPRLVCLQYAIDDGAPRIETDKAAARALFRHWLDNGYTIVAHNGFFDYSVLLDLTGYWAPGYLAPNADILRILRACRNGQIRDTVIMSKLNAIEFGWMGYDHYMRTKAEFNLAYLVDRFLGAKMVGKKEPDAWRFRYSELEDVPLDQWPAPAVDYALADVTLLRDLYARLDSASTYPDEGFQTAVAWVMRLMELWGMHTDAARVARLKARVEPDIEAANKALIEMGLMRPGDWETNQDAWDAFILASAAASQIDVPRTPGGAISKTAKFLAKLPPLARERKNWQTQGPPIRNMHVIKTRIVDWYTSRGLDVPMVDKKHKEELFEGDPDEDTDDPTAGVATDREALTSTDDPGLVTLGKVGKLRTLATTFIPKMEMGHENPLRSRWNPLVVTGRPSCSAGEFGTNLLNQPREIEKGEAGVREVYKARPGYVYIDGDATQAELCGLAQICLDKFGYSVMGDIIRAGKDLHCWFGAILVGRSYDDVVLGYSTKEKWALDARQMAKCANFGFPGGLGAKKFVKWARKTYEVNFSIAQVKALKAQWLSAFPEIVDYFNWVNEQLGYNKKFTYTQHRSNRRRGNCGFCDGANTGFQGIVADAVKNAMLMIFEACHTPGDALYGSRLCAQIYDEMLIEVPVEMSSAAAVRFVELFEAGMKVYIPDVPPVVTCEMMHFWSKKAKAVFDDKGNMVPYDAAS